VNTKELDFFHQKLAANFDGYFDGDFWSTFVMQLTHTEPAVRHAVSAISAIHKDVDKSISSRTGFIKADPVAMQEWNASMSSLTARIKAYPNSNLVPLVCCLLFTCLEFLKGNVDTALVHIQSGFKILATVLEAESTTIENDNGLKPSDYDTIRKYIVPMFSRLNSLCTLFGRVTPPVYAITDRSGIPHIDLSDARQRIAEILDPALRFIRVAGRKTHTFELNVEDFVEQVKLQDRLEEWRKQFEDLLRRLPETERQPNEESISLLRIQHKIIYIWLGVCTSAEETAVDPYYADFADIVKHAAILTKSRSRRNQPQPLSFEMQLIGPLYYTATKCRDPILRRQALHLLNLAPRREGLWNAHHAFKTAERVIEIEERNCNEQGLPLESARLLGVHLPTEDSRIYNLGELPADFRTVGQNLVPNPAMPGVIQVIFRTKPFGVLGPFHTVTEHVVL
jgi:hypothetical protein